MKLKVIEIEMHLEGLRSTTYFTTVIRYTKIY